MAKKSTKSTRRARAKKQEPAKKKPATTKTAVATTSEASAVKTKQINSEGPIEAAVEAEADKLSHESAKEITQPTRNRMIISAVALCVIIVALIFGAAVIRQQNADKQAESMVKSGQVSGKADEILQSGGIVCTNGNSQTDTTGSANPDSVGMMLQTNPTNGIQTPQTFSGGNDANTLQGASCF